MKRIVAILTVVITLAGAALALAQSQRTADVQVRVWQRESDAASLYISARPEGGSWATLGTIPLDMAGRTDSGFRYADIELAVPLPDAPTPAAAPSPTPTTNAPACGREAVAAAVRASVVHIGYYPDDDARGPFDIITEWGSVFRPQGVAFYIGNGEFLTAGHLVSDIAAFGVPLLPPDRSVSIWTYLVGGFPTSGGDVAILRTSRAQRIHSSRLRDLNLIPLQPRLGALTEGEDIAHARAGEAPRWATVIELVNLNMRDAESGGFYIDPAPLGSGQGVSVARSAGDNVSRGDGLIEPGWSGAPMLDRCARIVGMAFAGGIDSFVGRLANDRNLSVVEPSLGRAIADIRTAAEAAAEKAASSLPPPRIVSLAWWNREMEIAFRAQEDRLLAAFERAFDRESTCRLTGTGAIGQFPDGEWNCQHFTPATGSEWEKFWAYLSSHPCGERGADEVYRESSCRQRWVQGF